MRWPDLFFKSRKNRPVPEITTVPAPTPEDDKPPKATAPAKTETLKLGAAMSEHDKTESLRALIETDQVRAPAPTAPASPEPGATQPLDECPAPETDPAQVKTTALPPVTRPGTLSLRQRAKLTEDARSRARPENEAPPAAEPPAQEPAAGLAATVPLAPGPDAVVPPAFTVPVETGSILEPSAAQPDILPVAPAAGKNAPGGPTATEPAETPVAAEGNKPGPNGASAADSADASPAPGRTTETAAGATRAKQEFVLANGERILGHVLSETPQTIYLDHGTLGVLTLPRAQVAKKPIEVILINGDRIVGDLIAETSECLYIKHASLGMVTVPHGQRSARVVEAILKDGDRILGEVLAETDHFTVIRSATLGTVAVQHEQVAMLNRKIEQMQLRALPGPVPALADKKE